MPEAPTLSLRELNRATLARQLLLRREPLGPLEAIERLVSLQAQFPKPPYTGLWTRVEGFERRHLTKLITDQRVVRATMMRHTLHLIGSRDYALLRMTVQPALTRSFGSIAGKRMAGVDMDGLLGLAARELSEHPRTFAEMRVTLAAAYPDRDPSAMGYAVRTFLPLVQLPSGAEHGYPAIPQFTLAGDFLSEPFAAAGQERALIRRYLAAFGPAAVRDIQAWSGLGGLKLAADQMRDELMTFRDESGRELLDLDDAPRPPADTPAPARFLPDFDNLIVGHADRTRIIADEHRRKVSLPAAVVRATFLLDGFVAGTWKLERAKGAVTLVIEPFGRLARAQRDELAAEGERLVTFLEPDRAVVVRFETPR